MCKLFVFIFLVIVIVTQWEPFLVKERKLLGTIFKIHLLKKKITSLCNPSHDIQACASAVNYLSLLITILHCWNDFTSPLHPPLHSNVFRRKSKSGSSWSSWRTWSATRSWRSWKSFRSWRATSSWLSARLTWRETSTHSNMTSSCRWLFQREHFYVLLFLVSQEWARFMWEFKW